MKKNICLLLMLVLSMSLAFSGCGKKEQVAQTTTTSTSTQEVVETQEPITLNWTFPNFGGDFTNVKAVNDALNILTQEKLNAKIVLNPVPQADYETKMNVKIATGEDMDIVWTSSWMFSYDQNAGKGAFAPIDDLMSTVPDLKATMPQSIWDMAKYNGVLYGIPGNQIMASKQGVSIQKRFVDKYNFDLTTVKSVKDLEPLLEQIKKNEPGIVPFGAYDHGTFLTPEWFRGPSTFTTHYKIDDQTCKVFSMFETPEYKEHLDLMRSWFLKGYIAQDTAVAKISEVEKTGKVASYINVTMKPGGDIDEKAKNGGFDMVSVAFNNKPVLNSPKVTMNAIVQSSKNKEGALKFLELLNVNKEAFDLVSYGVKGVNYISSDDIYFKAIDKSGYAPVQDWVFGNQFLGLLKDGMSADVWEQTKIINESAIIPTLNGIPYNDTNVKNENNSLSAIYQKYGNALAGGAVDPAKVLPEFISKLKASGLDKVILDEQKQVDAFLATKK